MCTTLSHRASNQSLSLLRDLASDIVQHVNHVGPVATQVALHPVASIFCVEGIVEMDLLSKIFQSTSSTAPSSGSQKSKTYKNKND